MSTGTSGNLKDISPGHSCSRIIYAKLETLESEGYQLQFFFIWQSGTGLLLEYGVMRRLRRSPVGVDLG